MKISILSTLFCLFALSSWAETTTDHVAFPELTINPGGDYLTVTAIVEGISKYSGVGMEIRIPDGYEFVQLQLENADEELEWMYANRGAACKSTHACKSNLLGDGTLKIAIYSSLSSTFKESSNELFTFFIKAPSFAKPGEYVDIQISNCFFSTSDAVQYDTADENVNDKIKVGTTAATSITVSSTTKWATFVSPCTTNEIPTGVEAYRYKKLVTAENKVYLQKQTSLEAYVPYLLYAEEGFTGTVTGTATATQYEGKVVDGIVTDGLLVGAITKQSANQGYVLQNLSEGVKFYSMAGNTFTIPTGKCYLMPADATSSKLSIAFEETDGIKSVNANGEDTIYDLSGRKLQSTTQHGIYIVNGKKVVK